MKKVFAAAAIMLAAISITAVNGTANSEDGSYVIGVPVYDINDNQVEAFRDYLENYIGIQFDDVTFLYSQSIHSAEEETAFLQSCIENGADGILAFNSYDLKAEVELCAENEVYYIKPSSTPSAEDFELVKENPYFLGYFGPGEEMEYQAGAEMADWFIQQAYGDHYVIFSGGAPLGNAMHIERTTGILDTLASAYGAEFDKPIEELVTSDTPVTAQAGNLTVTICGGYIEVDPFYSTAKDVLDQTEKDVVLSVIPPASLADDMGNAKLGVIDCYSATNSDLFAKNKLQYLCGKYSSIIGPAFAALYNAMTGYSEDFRENGDAFHITQGFWVSDSAEDFNQKYELSSGIAINAYSYFDILQVIKAYDPEAGFDDLKTLGESWDYEASLDRVMNGK